MSHENYASYDLPWDPGMTGNLANDWPNRPCNKKFGCVNPKHYGLIQEGYDPSQYNNVRENCGCGGGGYQPLSFHNSRKKREEYQNSSLTTMVMVNSALR